MRLASRTAIVCAAAVSLAGCLSFGSEPPESLLTLTSERTASAGQPTQGTGQTALTVVEPTAPQRLSVNRVPVQVDDASVAYLKDALWVEKPTRLFRRLLSETIRASGNRVVVDGFDPTLATGDQLRGSLVDFGYDARTSSVVVRFDAVREDGADVITTQRFESVVPGVPAEVGPVGDALNRAANDVAQQVAQWIGS